MMLNGWMACLDIARGSGWSELCIGLIDGLKGCAVGGAYPGFFGGVWFISKIRNILLPSLVLGKTITYIPG